MKIRKFNEDIEIKKRSVDSGGLKMEKRTVYFVDYGDFNRFVKDTYGGDYNFVSDMESSNDTSHDFYVTGSSYVDEAEVENIRKGIYDGYCADIILDIMAADGLIPKGEYIIRVSW